MENQKVRAYRYSKEDYGNRVVQDEEEIIDSKTENGAMVYIVRTQDGIVCTAIFNPITCCFYADDVYGVIEKHQCDSNMNMQFKN